jgi:uncharacterized membrane protein
MCRIYRFLGSRSCYIFGVWASFGYNLYYMLRNYLKTALRNLWRNKGFSTINILGLTIGIAIAVVIAVPLSVWAINRWLEGFAYHITVNWLIFPLAALVALLFAWVTVSFESLRAAVMNPARSLKVE